MIIREEKPADFAAIRELVRTAFLTAEHTDGNEQNFVEGMRASDAYIPSLALVAEDPEGLAGHVMLTRATVGGRGVVLVAPLCVGLSHRRLGVGARLMEEGLRRARKMGCPAAFLLGDPAYYGRFGFVRASQFGIGNTDGFPDEYFLACELFPGALAGVKGNFIWQNPCC